MVEDRINRSQEARCCLVKIRLDWCHVFSYQSPMPAVADTPRYENWVHRSIEGFRCRLCPPPHPWLGTSPSPTFLSCDPGLSVVRATVVGVAGRRRNPSRIGVRDMPSYQSLMPAVAGTPRYQNCVHRSIEGFRCRLCPRPAPWLGTSPSPTFLSCDPGLSLFGRRWLVSPAGAGIDPGSESGTCLRTNRSCRLSPAHQGIKIACIDRSKGSGVVCAPAPHLDGDKPQRYISLATLGCRCSGDDG